ncbi:MAG: hypothetical protein ABI867_24900 [Kofleriaceae bacterium]
MRKLVVAIALAALVSPAWAKKDKKPAADEEEEVDDTEETDKPDKKKPAAKAEPDEAEDTTDVSEDEPKKKSEPFKKQDLTGHDIAGAKSANMFEQDRFFVDKRDDKKTSKKTLIQGALTSTSFLYKESGAQIGLTGVSSNSQYARLFTDLRLQTDFRHIAGGKWDARVDTRARAVTNPGASTDNFVPIEDSHSQSGLTGEAELEIKELWLIRNGKRSDVILGRQFIPDLAGVKFDGLRIDYASSSKFTFLGFGGLYPVRGSRSITTDYQPLKGEPDAAGVRADAGKFVGTGGFGAAYRTQNAYGAFGGVVIAPLSSESPRIFGTATGYWRNGPKLDIYHFGVIDVLGSNAGLTNVSAGLNYKPDQRLRATLSVNRVDTETLNVQAQAFLNEPDLAANANIIQNEAFLIRVAQNQMRGSLSAGLGSMQRVELTVATAVRYRGEITLTSPTADMPLTITLPAGKSVEVYGSIVDRRSFAKLRLGVDGSQIFKIGSDTYNRSASLGLRAFVARELASGHGEWEAEIAYASTKDDKAGTVCGIAGTDIATCYGASNSTVLSLGGNLFYRFNRDWFGMGGLFLNRQNITSFNGAVGTADPAVTGISGFVRVAYRF